MFNLIEEMHIPEGSLFPAYTPSAEDRDLMTFLLPLYEAYRQKPPKLSVQGVGHLTLHAGEPIRKGAVVVEYLGSWEPGSKTPSSYRFGPINGLHYRNLAAMAEDGFPNMTPFYLYAVRGLPLRVIFVALEDIAAGQMLVFNYGPKHSVKLEEHAEYRYEQMAAFVQGLGPAFQRIKELHTQRRSALGFELCLELENLVAKTQYVFQTPSALSALLQQGDLTPEVFSYWDKPDYRYYLLGVPFTPSRREQEWIESIEAIKSSQIRRSESLRL